MGAEIKVLSVQRDMVNTVNYGAARYWFTRAARMATHRPLQRRLETICSRCVSPAPASVYRNTGGGSVITQAGTSWSDGHEQRAEQGVERGQGQRRRAAENVVDDACWSVSGD